MLIQPNIETCGNMGHAFRYRIPCVQQHCAFTTTQRGSPTCTKGSSHIQTPITHASLTNSGLSRASLPPVRALEFGVRVGITLCLGLTPQPSSNWEMRSCLWRHPSSAAMMPFPLISLSSPYALPLFCSPAMQVPSWPVPHPLSDQVSWGTRKMRMLRSGSLLS